MVTHTVLALSHPLARLDALISHPLPRSPLKNSTRAALLCAALSALMVAGTAGPAIADEGDGDLIYNATTVWAEVDHETPQIRDAQSRYEDILGTGVELAIGWATDAFDGIFYEWYIAGHRIDWDSASQPQINHGGASTLHYLGTAGDDGEYEVAARLEIEGSYARWTLTQTAGTPSVVRASVDHGADGYEDVTTVTANSAVVIADSRHGDPVIGLSVSGTDANLTAEPGDGYASWEALLDQPSVAVVAVQDYAACQQDEVVAQMISRVANLNDGFGASLHGALECASVVAPAALSEGSATSQTLPYAVDPAIDAALSNRPNYPRRGAYLSDPTVVDHRFVGGPAGVDFAFDPATAQVAMTGAPTEAGVFTVTLLTFHTNAEDYVGWTPDDEVVWGHPLTATFTVTVDANDTLAATGLSANTWLIAGLAAVAAMLGMTLVRRSASAR